MKMRKLLSMLLATLMLLTMIPLGAVGVSAASPRVFTETEFVNKLNELRAKYPNGGTYSGTYYEGDKAYAWTCHGYACQMFYDVFGVRYYADGYRNQKNYTMGTIHAGDLVRLDAGYGPDTHTVFVTKVTSDRIYFTDANYRGKNDIRWDVSYTKADFANRFTYKVTIPGNTLTGTGTHSHSHDQYVYYLAAHPHHKCYQCSCGDVAADYSTSTYVDTCLECTLPGTPSLSGMKQSYTDQEPIVFEWEEVNNATHYNLLLKSEDAPGEWVRYDHIFYVTNGMTIYLPVGNYQCYLQAYNSNVFWEDGSDWQYTASAPYYFSVIKACEHTYDNACDTTCNSCGATREVENHAYLVTITTPATCGVAGEKTSICDLCGHTYTEIIPATGEHTYNNDCDADCNLCGATREAAAHVYTVETIPATCTTAGVNVYTCSVCGDSYEEIITGGVSDWSTEYPADVDEQLIESKQEYRYREWQETTKPITENGWILDSTYTRLGDYGAWSAWSNTAISGNANTQVETRTIYPYYYYRCPNCGAHMHVYLGCYTWAGGCGKSGISSEDYVLINSTVPYSSAGLQEFHGTGRYYTYLDGQLVFRHRDGSKTQYRSRTKQQETVYNYYRYSEWADWSDACNAANAMVEERTVYRYRIEEFGDHTYNHDYDATCNTCGAVREAPPAGDANGDGEISVRDVALLQQYLGGWDVTLDESAAYADGDGRITVRDVALLQQYLANWDVTPG